MALNDPSALGALAAIEGAGLSDRFLVYGVDGSPEGKVLVADGLMTATSAQMLSQMVGTAVDQAYLAMEVDRYILGTIAVKDFGFTARMARKYGPRIAVGVDLRDGCVAVAGWREVTPEPGLDFCRRCADAGVQAIIATDISRDGTLRGTNLELYRALLQIPGLRVTASGGIARMEELAELSAMGCHGAILGQSIYTGAIDLAEAVRRYQS